MKKIYFLVVALFFYGFASAQIVNIPDANFKAKLLSANASNGVAKNSLGSSIIIDINNNNEIEVVETAIVSKLFVSSSDIADLTGIEIFTNLKQLNCSSNQLTSIVVSNNINLTELDVSNNLLTSINTLNNSALKYLICKNNQINSLILVNNSNLFYLNCENNQLLTLDVSNLNLHNLYCSINQLTTLDLSNNSFLRYLECFDNQISALNLSNNTVLFEFNCSFNQLTNLNLSNNLQLYKISCFNNQLTALDLESNQKLGTIRCQSNLLQSINMKNGNIEGFIEFDSNPNLQYICADGSQITQIQDKLTQYGYVNCNINSYCSFTPGGTFYTIQGNQKLDSNNNGCDTLDINFPNLQCAISNSTSSGSLFSNSTGNYSIPVQAGTYTIAPILQNPTYFNISPANLAVTFPAQTSPFTQNFCITPNGIHHDLEIVIIPNIAALPGFEAVYKVIFMNKGNIYQSGTVNLTFNDSVLDLVSAVPTVTTQTLDNLTWDFTNLQPFETREITFTLNVNSPTATPAVNDGDILNYVATITSPATDEMPSDNTFVYDQTVVNSFDPNDKTCLEGATISQAKVGDYVHYMIRFENNGTANAQNIVVKDMIDLTKFDISSLIPIKGSHSFVTNISAGNKVEFIFENIQLPFDNANNDGYVAFKIKTKSSLVSGDAFSNTASIYFDYNFPIITNTATTTIQALAKQDFEFASYFTIYPNPVKDVLKIDFKNSIEVQSINIYNTLGQLVLVIPNAQNTNNVDVSSLKSGNYFVKINSDKGTSSSKFIKQ